MRTSDREYVQSLERGLAVIESFGAERPTMTLSEVAARTGLTRAAARRFLHTLVKLGHVGSDGKLFWLRPRVLDLGYHYLLALPWWQIAQPIIEEASRSLRESCSACVLDGSDIVYVSRVSVNRLITTHVSIGSRLPAYPTALGRVLLSQLADGDLRKILTKIKLTKLTDRTIVEKGTFRDVIDEVRAQGYAIVNEELDLGLRALAVPIVDRRGQPLAAVGVSVNAGRVSAAELLKTALPLLRESSARITHALPEPLRR